MDYFTTLGFFSMTLLPSLTTVLVVGTNAFYFSSKSPPIFLTVIPGLSYFFCNVPLSLQFFSYHTNPIHLVALGLLGNPTKAVKLKIISGILQGVPPLSSFLY